MAYTVYEFARLANAVYLNGQTPVDEWERNDWLEDAAILFWSFTRPFPASIESCHPTLARFKN